MIKKIECLLWIALIILCVKLGYDLYCPSEQGRNLYVTDQSQKAEKPTEIESAGQNEQSGVLPGIYDSRENGRAPSVKNQGDLGTCWAVTATSALEASLMPNSQKIFSADHMSLQNGFSKKQNDGGDYKMVMAYLAGWQGPVLEEEDPYGDGVSPEGLLPAYHVQEMQLIKSKDYEAVKQAVMKYGAVQSSIYMDLKNEFSTSIYYNQLEYSYYYNGEAEANHDILIIGWDDAYPAEKFNVNTKNNGAFICQNSWGENFADSGIFYISYEDVNIGKNNVVYSKIESNTNYDKMYQTDQCGWVGQLGYGDDLCWFANKYQAESQETLAAVGFYSVGEDTSYQIFVLEIDEKMPSLAMEEPIVEGKLECAGFYTVSLDEEVVLKEGHNYFVAVKIHTPDAQYPVATEYAADEATKDVDILDGEGYISHNGVIWTNTESEHACNVCLKMYTKRR